jgi:hypothetical protein
VLSAVLAVLLSLGQLPVLANESIKASVNSIGYVGLLTVAGDPGPKSDDNRFLLRVDPEDMELADSFVLLQVDGEFVKLGPPPSTGGAPFLRGNALHFAREVSQITVDQSFTIETGLSSGRKDAVRWSCVVENKGKSRKIGVAVVLNTQLGMRDNAPFLVPGVGTVDSERTVEFKDNPGEVLCIDRVGEPWGRFALVFRGAGLQKPHHMHFLNWDAAKSSPWKFAPASGKRLSDSGLVLVWDPVPYAQGTQNGFLFQCEVAGGSATRGEPFSLFATCPKRQYGAASWIVLAVENSSAAQSATDVAATAKIPAGLELVSGQGTVALGKIEPGEVRYAWWGVRTRKPGTYTVELLVKGRYRGKNEAALVQVSISR